MALVARGRCSSATLAAAAVAAVSVIDSTPAVRGQPETFSPVVWDDTVHLPLEARGERRQYHVLLPASLGGRGRGHGADNNGHSQQHGGRRPPAIVLLHGYANNASVFAADQTLTAAARLAGYALIFPDGIRDPSSVLPCHERSWNAGTCCGPAVVDNVDDVTFLREAVADAVRRYDLDARRVFITGASNGGSMVVRAVCELGGEVFAGAAADVASIENVHGEACATRCVSNATGDGYVYCTWDRDRKGCRPHDWLGLPTIFECKRRGPPVPIIFFNGNFDPYSSALIPGEKNNTGQISYPVDPSVPGQYNTTFPPLSYATAHFAERVNGCASGGVTVSFRNGTKGNATVCRTWAGCDANVTSCLSDAGHTWFGDFFSQNYSLGLCEYETGGPPNDATCFPAPGDPPPIYNTYSINETAQTLAFFDSIVAARVK